LDYRDRSRHVQTKLCWANKETTVDAHRMQPKITTANADMDSHATIRCP
jgi:hypothetical protein